MIINEATDSWFNLILFFCIDIYKEYIYLFEMHILRGIFSKTHILYEK